MGERRYMGAKRSTEAVLGGNPRKKCVKVARPGKALSEVALWVGAAGRRSLKTLSKGAVGNHSRKSFKDAPEGRWDDDS